MTAPSIDAAARQEIAELLTRYATGIDQRDWALLRSCFTDDCVADYGDIGLWNGSDEITGWMDEAHRACGFTLHRITNQAVRVDGDEVRARCYVDAVVMGADNRRGVRAIGFYDDVVVQTSGGWQISHRRFTPVHFQGIDDPAAS